MTRVVTLWAPALLTTNAADWLRAPVAQVSSMTTTCFRMADSRLSTTNRSWAGVAVVTGPLRIVAQHDFGIGTHHAASDDPKRVLTFPAGGAGNHGPGINGKPGCSRQARPMLLDSDKQEHGQQSPVSRDRIRGMFVHPHQLSGLSAFDPVRNRHDNIGQLVAEPQPISAATEAFDVGRSDGPSADHARHARLPNRVAQVTSQLCDQAIAQQTEASLGKSLRQRAHTQASDSKPANTSSRSRLTSAKIASASSVLVAT